MATELTSTTITNILEAVPGIKTVLRSPAADAMVNLTRAAAGVGPFEIKDARELMRFAFRRGLINNDEHDHVLSDVEGAAQAKQEKLAARQAARDGKHRVSPKRKAASAKKLKPRSVRATKKAKPAPKKAVRRAPKKAKPAPKKAAKRAPKKAKPVPRKAAKRAPKKPTARKRR